MLSGVTAQVLTSPLFVKSLKGQMGSKLGTAFNMKPSLSLVGRGALIGVCHLSVMQAVLDFLEQPLDPFGTKMYNVDERTRSFLSSVTDESDGDLLLRKLQLVGYFD